MPKPYKLSLHIFRRDLRLQDNTALIEALKLSDQVIPCFIFDKRQIDKNDYKSNYCLAFMANSLAELNSDLMKHDSQLYFFYGIAEEIMTDLLAQLPIEAVFINRDYTPFSQQRDRMIADVCKKNNVHFSCHADALLHEPEESLKADGKPYTMFTPFYKRTQLLPVKLPQRNSYQHYYQKNIAFTDKNTLTKLSKLNSDNMLLKGGRKEGLTLLKHATTLTDYDTQRNFPAEDATTHLSAHNKFGTLSIREVYQAISSALGRKAVLISELFWRDFFTHITFHFPHVIGHAFHKKYDQLQWSKNMKHFQAWCEGMTGFPIVDAGMRELRETGYMHNRVRMITASFLVKDLHIDWRWGEKHFAQHLIDYDPAVNNGNWQWAASTGCDAQPYFRVFNPWLQQKRFDPDHLYIRRWVPDTPDYPKPIIEHDVESTKSKNMYRNL